jgi:hypothetical protein
MQSLQYGSTETVDSRTEILQKLIDLYDDYVSLHPHASHYLNIERIRDTIIYGYYDSKHSSSVDTEFVMVVTGNGLRIEISKTVQKKWCRENYGGDGIECVKLDHPKTSIHLNIYTV